MERFNQTFVGFLRSKGYSVEEVICELSGVSYVINDVSYSSKDLHQSEFSGLIRCYHMRS